MRHCHQEHGCNEIVNGGVVDEKHRQFPTWGYWFVGHVIS